MYQLSRYELTLPQRARLGATEGRASLPGSVLAGPLCIDTAGAIGDFGSSHGMASSQGCPRSSKDNKIALL
ncbi:hypothetical protein PGT21_031424 [Puccinia graminis f. sp. tritici]|uniref:Uncharacterized protein n=1 Tax=Puccinia graminis f. sp. tritici TaxID=56615 RepID=A0A5B0MMD5_PUCGR|nr:hypothetical protein PGT21_031424 [Puccinia graminis f. sp. tritici]